jgi:hypothetical protein
MLTLITMIMGGIPQLQLCSLLGLIGLLYLYRLVDQLGPGLKLLKVSVYQLLFSVPIMGIIVYLNYGNPQLLSGEVTHYLSLALLLGLLLILAYTNYLVANYLLQLSKQLQHNLWFKLSGILTKVAAFTMPVFGIGMLLLLLAQPIFLLGCITLKSHEVVVK